jgi:mortality factor 4-like protein 1
MDTGVEQTQYYIHYHNWNNAWDEWVTADRVIPNNDDGKRLKQQLEEEQPPTPSTKKRLRQNEEDSELFADSIRSYNMNMTLPPALVKDLLQDYQDVHDKKQAYKLPRPQTVDSLLVQFLEEIKQEQEVKRSDGLTKQDYELFEFVVNGIRSYFNAALGPLLLYQCERKQFDHEKKNNKRPDTLYGYEHLLRFFVKLPVLLERTQMSQEAVDIIQERVLVFYNFLEREHQKKS